MLVVAFWIGCAYAAFAVLAAQWFIHRQPNTRSLIGRGIDLLAYIILLPVIIVLALLHGAKKICNRYSPPLDL